MDKILTFFPKNAYSAFKVFWRCGFLPLPLYAKEVAEYLFSYPQSWSSVLSAPSGCLMAEKLTVVRRGGLFQGCFECCRNCVNKVSSIRQALERNISLAKEVSFQLSLQQRQSGHISHDHINIFVCDPNEL